MPSLNSTTIAARISNERLAEIEQELNGRTVNRWLNDVINEHFEGVPRGNMGRLAEIAIFFGGDINTLMGLMADAIENGEIVYDGKKLLKG